MRNPLEDRLARFGSPTICPEALSRANMLEELANPTIHVCEIADKRELAL